MTTWEDDMETHDSVDDFIAAVRGEPTDAQLKALGIYSTRRTGARVERRLAGDLRANSKPLPDVVDSRGRRWRPVASERGLHGYIEVEPKPRKRLRLFYAVLWLAHRDVVLAAICGTLLWLALWWALG